MTQPIFFTYSTFYQSEVRQANLNGSKQPKKNILDLNACPYLYLHTYRVIVCVLYCTIISFVHTPWYDDSWLETIKSGKTKSIFLHLHLIEIIIHVYTHSHTFSIHIKSFSLLIQYINPLEILILSVQCVKKTAKNMTSFEKYWLQSCDNRKIPPEIAKNWLKSIQTKYNTESNRIYHNFNVLIKKCDFLESLEKIGLVNFSDYLIFAIAFQYHHFDLKSNCNERNCIAFGELCNEAAVHDVSVYHNCDFRHSHRDFFLHLNPLSNFVFVFLWCLCVCVYRHSSLIPYVTCLVIQIKPILEMHTM